MSFKEFSYLELWRPFCSVEQNHLCNFGRWQYAEQFLQIIFNLDQWFRRRCHLKYFLSRALAAYYSVEWNHLCNVERGHHGEYMKFGPVVKEEISFKDISYLELWRSFFRGTICAIYVDWVMNNNSVKLF